MAALVERIDPHVVFIDFDRTLCTTKSGSSPARGSHRLDAELWNVVTGGRLCRTKTDQSETRDVRVVTRNSHVDDIRAFMARHVAGGDSVVGSTPSYIPSQMMVSETGMSITSPMTPKLKLASPVIWGGVKSRAEEFITEKMKASRLLLAVS